MVLPKKQISRMQDLTESQQESLAVIMKILCTKYDNLFHCSFPYSMGWHGMLNFYIYLLKKFLIFLIFIFHLKLF